jgi:hypothetical protein
MAGQLRKYDIGSIIRVTVKENGVVFNASAAIGKTMKLKKPSGAVMERPAEFQTDGVDGIVMYTTVENDLNEVGPWTGQVFLDFAASAKWHTEPWSFTVGDNVS